MADRKTPHDRKTLPVTIPNLIEIDSESKAMLEHIMQYKKFETNSEAIRFLYREWKRRLPSMAGTCPNLAPFEREEDDPYRYPVDSDLR